MKKSGPTRKLRREGTKSETRRKTQNLTKHAARKAARTVGF